MTPNLERHGTEESLSDEALGIGVAVARVDLGATVIEKHFTLRRADKGPDCEFSLELLEIGAPLPGGEGSVVGPRQPRVCVPESRGGKQSFPPVAVCDGGHAGRGVVQPSQSKKHPARVRHGAKEQQKSFG